jgi:hypothetical protein
VGESEDVQAWAERQANRQRLLLEWLRGAPGRWASRKAALAATGLEFVYTYSAGDDTAPKSSTAHRVVKKTATRLYVERRGFSTERDPPRDTTEGTRILDRAALERAGRVFHRRDYGAYFALPYEDTSAWRSEVAARVRHCRARLTAESWLEHRRRQDEGRPASPAGRS